MAERHEITTTNQIVLSFDGSQTGGIGNLLCTDFSFQETTDDELKHGISNFGPIGIALNNVEYEFDVTLEGENAEACNAVMADPDNRPDISMYAIADDGMSWRIPHAWPTDQEFSGQDNETIEYSIQGLCMAPERSG